MYNHSRKVVSLALQLQVTKSSPSHDRPSCFSLSLQTSRRRSWQTSTSSTSVPSLYGRSRVLTSCDMHWSFCQQLTVLVVVADAYRLAESTSSWTFQNRSSKMDWRFPCWALAPGKPRCRFASQHPDKSSADHLPTYACLLCITSKSHQA